MKRIFAPTVSGSDWQPLLMNPKKHWKRGYSAMSAAACWEKHVPQLPREIVATLEASNDPALMSLELLAAMPEWKVKLPPNEKAPSQIDVLALTRNTAGLAVLGIEAKAKESFGVSLDKKRSVTSLGQKTRICFLEGKLNLSSPLDGAIGYQLLHRTVATLLTAEAFHAPTAVMLVQSFDPSSHGRDDFDVFVRAANAVKLTSNLYEINTVAHRRLLLGWCQDEQNFDSAELPHACSCRMQKLPVARK